MLAVREWVRFFRQPFRVIAAFGQPILFWVLFGTGLHGSFRSDQSIDFMGYYLPGTIALILLFTAIFTTISIIEDRREGFLQNVIVAPVPRWTIALGKTLGGTAIAWAQAMFFVLLLVISRSIVLSFDLIPLMLLMAVAAFGMTALGVAMAWPLDSTQAFHALMNLVLMPMWVLSGAFFPLPHIRDDAPLGQTIMFWIMQLNPMTYPIAGMRWYLSNSRIALEAELPSLTTCWMMTAIFATSAFIASVLIVQRNAKGDKS